MTHARTTISGNVGAWLKDTEKNSPEESEFIFHVARIFGSSYDYKINGVSRDIKIDIASQWLTEHVAPEGYYFGYQDEKWGMWKKFETEIANKEKIIDSMINHWLEDQTILRDNLRYFILRSWEEDPDQYKLDYENYYVDSYKGSEEKSGNSR